jgi:hypothetical protein
MQRRDEGSTMRNVGSTVWRFGLALLLAAHGVAHAVGFLVPWGSAIGGTPYDTTLLGGLVDVGGAGMLVMGLLYLGATVAFLLAAVAVAQDLVGWRRWTLGVAAFSTGLTVTGWPATQIGLYLDLVLIAALLVVPRVGMGARRARAADQSG